MRGNPNFSMSCPVVLTRELIDGTLSREAISEVIKARCKVAERTLELMVDQYLAKRASRAKE